MDSEKEEQEVTCNHRKLARGKIRRRYRRIYNVTVSKNTTPRLVAFQGTSKKRFHARKSQKSESKPPASESGRLIVNE
jgi:hypothetical protein